MTFKGFMQTRTDSQKQFETTFFSWMQRNRKLGKFNRNYWIDCWNDFREENLSCDYSLNTRPNRR